MKKGLSLAKMEAATGISGVSLNQYENDVYEADISSLKCLADFFDVSLDYLLYHSDSPRVMTAEYDRLLTHYDGLTPEGRHALVTLMDALQK